MEADVHSAVVLDIVYSGIVILPWMAEVAAVAGEPR